MLPLSACAPNDQEAKELELATSNYEDAIAIHYLAKAVLENDMDYDVDMTHADLGAIFTSLADGDLDAYLATWLPVTHGSYMDDHGENLEDLGTTYEGATLGFAVPDYVDIDSITELNEYSDEFNDEIVGIDSGAGLMELSEEAEEEYDLDLELVYSSDHAMTATLEDAYENEEGIVVTGWTPHMKFARMDLKFLDDPEGVFGEEEDVYVRAKEGFQEDNPEAAEFFENIYLTDEEYGDLIDVFDQHDEGEEIEAAEAWIEDNREVVEEWIP